MLSKYVKYVAILDTRYKTVKEKKNKKTKSLATGDLHWSQENKSMQKTHYIRK